MELLVRKDRKPECTVSWIEELLKNIQIETKLTLKVKNDLFYSCRLQIDGMPFGTNGKGVTEEYALASGYAEFMERFQSGCLVNYQVEYSAEQKPNKELCISGLKKYFSSIYDLENDKIFDELYRLDPSSFVQVPFYNVFEEKMEFIPEKFLSILCGSNGLCAGNTPHEALCQGICEVFERYALKKLYYDNTPIYVIPENNVCELSSYRLVKYLQNHHYLCYVLDMTCNGKFPVVGLLIIDPSRNKCKLALGSDINLDIALQRCITEIFQGNKLDLTFPMHMSSIFNPDVWGGSTRTLNKPYLDIEYMKQLTSNSGIIPLQCLINNEEFPVHHLNAFFQNKMTNKEVFAELKEKARSCNMDLYIRDLSVAGFPTFRVFIPEVSILSPSMSSSCNMALLSQKIEKEIKKEHLNYNVLLALFSEINTLTLSNQSYQFDKISGNIYSEKLLNDNRMIEIILLIKTGKIDDACIKYKDYYSSSNDYNYIMYYLHLLKDNQIDDLECLISHVQNNKISPSILKFDKYVKDFDNQINCYDCTTCSKNSVCLRSKIDGIKKTINELQDKHIVQLIDYKMTLSC